MKRTLKPLKPQAPKPDRRATYADQIEKAKDGKHRTQAIRVYCLRCCNWQTADVAACPSTSCPLYPYRKGGKASPSTDAKVGRYDVPPQHHDAFTKAILGKSRRHAIRTNCRLCSSWIIDDVQGCFDKECPLYPYRLKGSNVPTQAQVEAGRKKGVSLHRPCI